MHSLNCTLRGTYTHIRPLPCHLLSFIFFFYLFSSFTIFFLPFPFFLVCDVFKWYKFLHHANPDGLSIHTYLNRDVNAHTPRENGRHHRFQLRNGIASIILAQFDSGVLYIDAMWNWAEKLWHSEPGNKNKKTNIKCKCTCIPRRCVQMQIFS